MVECESCGEQHNSDSGICPYCGHSKGQGSSRGNKILSNKKYLFLALVLILILILGSVGVLFSQGFI